MDVWMAGKLRGNDHEGDGTCIKTLTLWMQLVEVGENPMQHFRMYTLNL